jgi:hypothetical protein
MPNVTCNVAEITPCARILKELGCEPWSMTRELEDIVIRAGWSSSKIIGRINWVTVIVAGVGCNPGITRRIPDKILTYRAAVKCYQIAKALEKAYDCEIELALESDDYYVSGPGCY